MEHPERAARRRFEPRFWLVAALCLAFGLVSLFGASKLTYEAEFIAIVEPPTQASGLPDSQALELWQDPPLSLLLTWRGETLAGMSEAISDLVFELNFEDGVEQVVSVFSLTLPGSGINPLGRALDNDGDPVAALAELRREALFGPSLLSPDLRTSLMQVQGGDHLALAARHARCEDGDALCVQSIGSKTIETTIQGELRSQNAHLPAVSVLLCILALTLFFGSLRRALLLMLPPLLGGLWYFGAMGLLGIPFDPFNAVIPTVVMTLGTANMLHLQRARDVAAGRGQGRFAALRSVLPAITITSFTTAVAFGSLYFEGSVLLERLALSGVLGVSVLWLVVVLLGPYCVGPRPAAPLLQRTVSEPLACGVRAVLAGRKRALKWGSAALMAAGVLIALTTPPDFTFHENIPDGETARAFDHASAEGLAIAPIFFTLVADDAARAEEQIVEAYAGTGWNVTRPADLRTEDGTYVLPYPIGFDATARQIKAVSDRVARSLSQAGAVTVSGYPSNVAETVLTIITNLQYILFACFALHALVIGLLMKSARIALASFLPNALPIFAIYAFMLLAVGWIDVAAAVAMILVSGLVVDDTTHILWAGRKAPGRNEFSISRGLERAFEPVLLTTIVLAAGFSPLLLSSLPGLQTLGGLMILALLVAWLADVLLLPALFREPQNAQD